MIRVWMRPGGRFPFLFGGTFIEAAPPPKVQPSSPHFPSFSEGLSLRRRERGSVQLRGGDFPSFSEGLSLRHSHAAITLRCGQFPFLFGGTFIEAMFGQSRELKNSEFPFLFGGTFIEAQKPNSHAWTLNYRFPFLFGGTFIEA